MQSTFAGVPRDYLSKAQSVVKSMFFLPATGSVLLSAVALFVATRAIAPSVLLVAFMGLRLVFLALFAAMFYCER